MYLNILYRINNKLVGIQWNSNGMLRPTEPSEFDLRVDAIEIVFFGLLNCL